MSKLYYESELYHHGVKGMKWGKRKTPQVEVGTSNAKSNAADTDTPATKATSKSLVNKAANVAKTGMGIGLSVAKHNPIIGPTSKMATFGVKTLGHVAKRQVNRGVKFTKKIAERLKKTAVKSVNKSPITKAVKKYKKKHPNTNE